MISHARMSRSKNAVRPLRRNIFCPALCLAITVSLPHALSAAETALSFDGKVNSRDCKIIFPSRVDVLSQISSLDFCGRAIKKDEVSGWSYFTNKGGWPQSFMTTITTGNKDSGFSTFIVEFSNSGAHTSFVKSFAKWLGGLDPY